MLNTPVNTHFSYGKTEAHHAKGGKRDRGGICSPVTPLVSLPRTLALVTQGTMICSGLCSL